MDATLIQAAEQAHEFLKATSPNAATTARLGEAIARERSAESEKKESERVP